MRRAVVVLGTTAAGLAALFSYKSHVAGVAVASTAPATPRVSAMPTTPAPSHSASPSPSKSATKKPTPKPSPTKTTPHGRAGGHADHPGADEEHGPRGPVGYLHRARREHPVR